MPGKDVKTMNRVILMGRLTKNPEIKYAGKDNDMAVARYTLAVNRKYKRDGEQEADFISCVTFGKSAEFAQKYLHKGMADNDKPIQVNQLPAKANFPNTYFKDHKVALAKQETELFYKSYDVVF